MIDVRNLPDAWEMIDKIQGNEDCEKDGLYDIYYNISVAIFEYRMKHNLSQKELAKKLGVTQAMVSKLESGDYNYTIEQLWKVAQKLNFKLNIVFEEIEQEVIVGYSKLENKDNIIDYPVYDLAVGS